MLKPAVNRLQYARVGIYGRAGSGKSRTAAEIAVGLYESLDLKRPVAIFDTEPSWSWLLPLFQQRGIEVLISDNSRSLVDLLEFYAEATDTCDIAIVDSITHPWRELQIGYLAKLNEGRKRPVQRLEFHHWGPIKAEWQKFSEKFTHSPIHGIMCGRAGEMYEYVMDEETGRNKVIATGTRMATEKELGHEPSLLIEMTGDMANEDERKKWGRKIINRALIEKDRGDTLNGRVFDFPNYSDFEPHFKRLDGVDMSRLSGRSSAELFTADGMDEWQAEKIQRTVLSEEIAGLIGHHFPGQSAEAKKARQELLREIFGTFSWTRISEQTKSAELRAGLDALRAKLEPKVTLEEPTDEEKAEILAKERSESE